MKNQQTKKIKKTVLGILGFSMMTLGLGLGINSTVFATFRKTELVDRNTVLSGIVKENVKQDSEKEVSLGRRIVKIRWGMKILMVKILMVRVQKK